MKPEDILEPITPAAADEYARLLPVYTREAARSYYAFEAAADECSRIEREGGRDELKRADGEREARGFETDALLQSSVDLAANYIACMLWANADGLGKVKGRHEKLAGFLDALTSRLEAYGSCAFRARFTGRIIVWIGYRGRWASSYVYVKTDEDGYLDFSGEARKAEVYTVEQIHRAAEASKDAKDRVLDLKRRYKEGFDAILDELKPISTTSVYDDLYKIK